jgi:hypothetical protein
MAQQPELLLECLRDSVEADTFTDKKNNVQVKIGTNNYSYTLKFISGNDTFKSGDKYNIIINDSDKIHVEYAKTLRIMHSSIDSEYYVDVITMSGRVVSAGLAKIIQRGGKHKYKGRTYKVRTGQRGGKYIMVGGSKIYV